MVLEIDLSAPFSLRQTCLAHGWVNLAPFTWDAEGEALGCRVRLGGAPRDLRVTQPTPERLRLSAAGRVRGAAVEGWARRALMLDWPAAPAARAAWSLDRSVARLVRAGAGRLLRSGSAFEDIVKTVCTINTTWRNSQAMVRGLVASAGDGAFPTPEVVLRLGEAGLRAVGPVGYRAGTLLALAEWAADAELDAAPLDALRAVRGLGPYAVDHIAVLRGDYARLPVDSEVMAYCESALGVEAPTPRRVHAHFEAWGEFKFLGYKLGRVARGENWIGDA